MEEIIAKLEQSIQENLGFKIIDKNFDGYYYLLAIKRGEHVFIIHTTKAILTCYKTKGFKMLQLKEHVPFQFVAPLVERFSISSYIRTATSNNNLLGIYSSGYSDAGIISCLSNFSNNEIA